MKAKSFVGALALLLVALDAAATGPPGWASIAERYEERDLVTRPPGRVVVSPLVPSTPVFRSVPVSPAVDVIVRFNGTVSDAAAAKRAAGQVSAGYAPGQALRATRLKMQQELQARERQSFEKSARLFGVRSRGIDLWAINAVVVSVPANKIGQLRRLPNVASVTIDRKLQGPSAQTSSSGTASWNHDLVNAPPLWSVGYAGSGVVVATMDTGADYTHPELAASWRGGNNSWFDAFGVYTSPVDLVGHGTQVLGLIAGSDSGAFQAGMAPGVAWIAARIFDDSNQTTISSIHAAYQWLLDPDGVPATDDAPDIVNNSWALIGTVGTCDTEFAQDIALLQLNDIAVVFSAGNFGPAADSSVAPANDPGVLSVGSVGNQLSIGQASSRGPGACDAGIYPKVVAPGEDVLTTDRMPLAYNVVSGTSFAAAHVSGGLAILKSAFPGASATELQDAIEASARDLGASGPDNTFGQGLLDLAAAYHALAIATGSTLDSDGDGYQTGVDCNDLDASVSPAARETKFDGIDQDCNGFDLTIDVLLANYTPANDRISVKATTALAAAGALQVRFESGSARGTVFPMTWDALAGEWYASIFSGNRRAGFIPKSVTVIGAEGEDLQKIIVKTVSAW